MRSPWSNALIVLLIALLLTLPSITLFDPEYSRAGIEDDGDGDIQMDGPVKGPSRARAPVTVFFDGLESGDFSGGPWNHGTGWQVSQTGPRTGTHHLVAMDQVTDSSLTMTSDIDLSNYKDVKATIYQHTTETEAQDLYYFEVSRNGGTNWDVKGNWNGQGLLAADYQEYNIDLGAYDRESNVRLRLRFTSSSDAEWWRIDDITLKGTPVILIDNASVDAQPREILRHNGTITFSGEFTDTVGYEAHQYKMTIGLRDPLGVEHIVLDNKTSGNDSLNIAKIGGGHFGFSFNWTPSVDFPFGTHDLMVKVWGPNGAGQVNYGGIPLNITLLSLPPYFEVEAVEFETEPINVMDYRGIPITVTFHDVDEQSPDDYMISLMLTGTEENITVMDNLTNETGLSVSMTENGTYEANYVWYPQNPENIVTGNYSVGVDLREGDTFHVNLTHFNITKSVILTKKYLPHFLSLSCDPSKLNVTENGKTTIRGEFIDIDTPNVDAFSIHIALRNEKNQSVIIADGLGHGQEGIGLQKTGGSRWLVSYEYDPPSAMPGGYYDIRMGAFDGITSLVFEDFDNNTDELFLYNNTSPALEEVELSSDTVNIYANSTCRFTAVFSDPDYEDMANYSINLSLRGPEGKIIPLVDSKAVTRSNPALPYLKPLEPPKFLFSYDIDPPESYNEGKYELYFEVMDSWGGRSGIEFGEEGMELGVFYNGIPTPPSRVWPNSTRDPRPLITWWGSSDEETAYEDLEYSIQIGTSPDDDTILPWHDNEGETEYRMSRDLGVGVYYIQVKAFDGEIYSDIAQSPMTITDGGNTPPTMPGEISPLFTVARNPKISWGESKDPDVSDIIEYYISIGTEWHSTDIIKNTPTGTNTYYQFRGDLDYGTYHIQIIAKDDLEYSPIREQIMTIFDPLENIPPMAPNSISPSVTRNPTPRLEWDGHMDLNEDELVFWIQMGTSAGASDVMQWTSTGKNAYFELEEPLPVNTYSVQIKCHDGKTFSDVFETSLRVLPPRVLIGPDTIMPGFSIDPIPLINWSGAHYQDAPDSIENFSYYIQLGTEPGDDDILKWNFVANRTHYAVDNPLPLGTDIYVQIAATDGSFLSETSTGMLRIGEFLIIVGFDIPNYVLFVEKGKAQTLRAFINNKAADNITVTLSVEGTSSRYVSIPNGTFIIPGQDIIWINLEVTVPETIVIGPDNLKFKLIASSLSGMKSARSEELLIREEEKKSEDFIESMGISRYVLGSLGIAFLTLVILLILIVRLWKREKRERFDLAEKIPELEKAPIDGLIPPDLYSTFRYTERRGLKEMDKVMVGIFKKYGVMDTAGKVKIKKKKIIKALGDGKIKKRKVKRLPPPAPGTVVEKTPLPAPEGKAGYMPPPPDEKTGLLPEGEPPVEPVPEETGAGPEFEYIPPDDGERDFGLGDGIIVDVEEVPAEPAEEMWEDAPPIEMEIPDDHGEEEGEGEDEGELFREEGAVEEDEAEVDLEYHGEEDRGDEREPGGVPEEGPEEIAPEVDGEGPWHIADDEDSQEAIGGLSESGDGEEPEMTKEETAEDVPDEAGALAPPPAPEYDEEEPEVPESDTKGGEEVEEEIPPVPESEEPAPPVEDDGAGAEEEPEEEEDEDEGKDEGEDASALDDIMNILGIDEE